MGAFSLGRDEIAHGSCEMGDGELTAKSVGAITDHRQVAFPAARRRFDDVVTGLELEIQQAIVAALTGWLAAKLEALSDLKCKCLNFRSTSLGTAETATVLSPSETEFTGLIATLSADNASSSRINTIIGHPDIQQQCPICSSPVDHGLGGTTACSKGHEWGESTHDPRQVDPDGHDQLDVASLTC